MKVEASKDFPKFWSIYEDWLKKLPKNYPPQANPVPEAKEPEVVGAEAPVEAPPPPGDPIDTEALKKKLKQIEKDAVAKQIMGQVLQQFKVNTFEDFLAWPDMIPTVEKFVADAPPAPASGKK